MACFDFRLPSPKCQLCSRLLIADCRLPIVDCRLLIVYVVDCRSPIVYVACRLLIVNCLCRFSTAIVYVHSLLRSRAALPHPLRYAFGLPECTHKNLEAPPLQSYGKSQSNLNLRQSRKGLRSSRTAIRSSQFAILNPQFAIHIPQSAIHLPQSRNPFLHPLALAGTAGWPCGKFTVRILLR